MFPERLREVTGGRLREVTGGYGEKEGLRKCQANSWFGLGRGRVIPGMECLGKCKAIWDSALGKGRVCLGREGFSKGDDSDVCSRGEKML